MFGFFNKRSLVKKKYKKYRQLLAESHSLSTTSRRASDMKYVEAQELLQEIQTLESKLS
jgi:hypothetical protein